MQVSRLHSQVIRTQSVDRVWGRARRGAEAPLRRVASRTTSRWPGSWRCCCYSASTSSITLLKELKNYQVRRVRCSRRRRAALQQRLPPHPTRYSQWFVRVRRRWLSCASSSRRRVPARATLCSPRAPPPAPSTVTPSPPARHRCPTRP